MKLAIPVDEDRKNVCVSFGRAPFILLHDADTGTDEFLENPAQDAESGAGPKASQFLVDIGADVLITVRCGENAAEVLNAAEIAVYKSEGSSAAENAAAFKAGRLSKLTHYTAGFMGIQ